MALGSREKQLGDILVEQGVISPLQLDEALQRQLLTGDMLGRVLVTMGLCEEQDIIESLGVQSGMERIDLSKLKIPEDTIRSLTADVAKFYSVIPIRMTDEKLIVAMADPLNIQVLDDLQQITGLQVQGAVSNELDVATAWKANYSFEGDSIHEMLIDLQERVGTGELSMEEMGLQQVTGDVDNLVELAQQPEVIKIVNLVFLEAVQKRASDIHFEIYEEDFRIRIRVDGILQEIVSPARHLAIALTSRIKVISNMDISERRMPQDNRIELKVGDTIIDIRVSTLPVLHGESVVMRILDRNAVKHDLIALGFPQDVFDSIDNVIRKPNGIMLVTGPTGSGKTTSLYASLHTLNKPDTKIITVEDPVEYQLAGINQVQINHEIKFDFNRALRAIMRQDPNIVMVGEIRDPETAEIAIKAALTGHLVFSTLHTNDTASSFTRLVDIGIKPFLVASGVRAILAQRLVRTICTNCKETYVPDEREIERLGFPVDLENSEFYHGAGCDNCNDTGHAGRLGAYELLITSDRIREMLMAKESSMAIKRASREEGMVTMREDAWQKALNGITTVEEVNRRTRVDEPLEKLVRE